MLSFRFDVKEGTNKYSWNFLSSRFTRHHGNHTAEAPTRCLFKKYANGQTFNFGLSGVGDWCIRDKSLTLEISHSS